MARTEANAGGRVLRPTPVTATALLLLAIVLCRPALLADHSVAIPIEGGQITITNPSFVVREVQHGNSGWFAVVKGQLDLQTDSSREWRRITIAVDLLAANGNVWGRPVRAHSLWFDVPDSGTKKSGAKKPHHVKFEKHVPVTPGTTASDVAITGVQFAVASAEPDDEYSGFTPSGVYVQYDLKDDASGYRYPVGAYDPFGNRLHYTYEAGPSGEAQIAKITQYLGSDTRDVIFTYQGDDSRWTQ